MLAPLKTIIWAFAMSCFLQRLSEIPVARKPTSDIFNSRSKLKHRQIRMSLRVTLTVPSVRASISKRQLAGGELTCHSEKTRERILVLLAHCRRGYINIDDTNNSYFQKTPNGP